MQPSPAPSPPAIPQIAILGGGIGGLAAAAFLHRAGLPCTVYEQAAQLTEIGAGVVVAPNAARLLRHLGLLGAFTERAVRLEVGWEFRRWHDGTVLSAEDLAARCEDLYGEHTYTAHRADLLGVLRSAVPPESIQLNRRCVAVSLRDRGRPRDARRGTGSQAADDDASWRPVVRFSDGQVIEPDVLIGADGIHSVVRATLTEATPPVYSGLCAFRGLVAARDAPAFARRSAQVLWLGPGHHLVHYPISGGRLVNLVAFAPAGDYTVESWTATATIEEFLAEFDGWDSRLTSLIRAAGTPGRWALLDRAPLKRWGLGPVTLLGDAAHPMFPFFGQGAAQAIEDAASLARFLAAAVPGHSPAEPALASALRRYEAQRIPRTTTLQNVSHARAHVNHLPDGPEQEARDKSFAEADPLLANGWIYSHDPRAIPQGQERLLMSEVVTLIYIAT
ncbi:MAG TPA: FAD-dependent monooxygenase [Trebonia sp.]|nr:FAD-dependent monooxygenase [Trebonia sp.]